MQKKIYEYLNNQLVMFEEDFEEIIKSSKKELFKAFSESWPPLLRRLTVYGFMFNFVQDTEYRRMEGVLYDYPLMDNQWNKKWFFSDKFIDKEFIFQLYTAERNSNLFDSNLQEDLLNKIKNFYMSIYDAKHQKQLRGYLNENYPNNIYAILKDCFFTRTIKISDIRDVGSYQDKKFKDEYINNEWNRIRGIVVEYLFKLIKKSSPESIYIPNMEDNMKIAFGHLLKKECREEKYYFSPFGFNRYYNCYFLLCVGIEKNFFHQYRRLFPLPEKEESYMDDTFAHRLVQIILEKEIEISTFQLNLTTSFYLIDNSASIAMLAARDMIEGRCLPPHDIYTALSSATYEGEYCQGEIIFIETIDTKSIMKEGICFSRPVPFLLENVRYIRKLLEMSKVQYSLVIADYDIIGLVGKPLDEKIKCFRITFSGFMKWSFWSGNKILFSYEIGKFKLPNIDNNFKWKDEVTSFFQIDKVSKIINIIESAIKQPHGTMLIIFSRDIDAIKEVSRLVEVKRGIQLTPPVDLSEKKEEILAMSAIDGAIVLDLNGICYGVGIIVDGKANISGTPSRGSRYNSANTYVHSLDNSIKCLACVISEDSTIDILTSRHLVS